MSRGQSAKELLAANDSAELEEMRVFSELYDIPDGHFVAARVGMAVARYMTGASVEPGDFAPIFDTEDDEATPDDNLRAAQAFAAAHNRG